MIVTQMGHRIVIKSMYNITPNPPLSILKAVRIFLPNQAQALPPMAKLQIIRNKFRLLTFQR